MGYVKHDVSKAIKTVLNSASGGFREQAVDLKRVGTTSLEALNIHVAIDCLPNAVGSVSKQRLPDTNERGGWVAEALASRSCGERLRLSATLAVGGGQASVQCHPTLHFGARYTTSYATVFILIWHTHAFENTSRRRKLLPRKWRQ